METITEEEKQEFIEFKIDKGLEEQRELSKNTIKALVVIWIPCGNSLQIKRLTAKA